MSSMLDISDKCNYLTDLILANKGKIVVLTGAGVSTAAGVPDYRGTDGIYRASKGARGRGQKNKLRLPECSLAKPTFTHMAIAKLVEAGFVRHVISQNVDGLHLRSGLKRERLSELHGNLFIERCHACKRMYYRIFDAAEVTEKGLHYTGRICDCCDPKSRVLLRMMLDEEFKRLEAKEAGHSKYGQFFEEASLVIQRRAAVAVSKRYKRTEKKDAPLLRDVVVHYGEVLLENNVNGVDNAFYAVHGWNSSAPEILKGTDISHTEGESPLLYSASLRLNGESPPKKIPTSIVIDDVALKKTAQLQVDFKESPIHQEEVAIKIEAGISFLKSCQKSNMSPRSTASGDSCDFIEMDTSSVGSGNCPSRRSQKRKMDELTRSNSTSRTVLYSNSSDVDSKNGLLNKAKDSEPASLILVVGSSLEVLRHYKFLWPVCLRGKHRLPKLLGSRNKKLSRVDGNELLEQPCKLAIVNLSRTCKDSLSSVCINERCDTVFRELMKGLGLVVPAYNPITDPLRLLAVPIHEDEAKTRTRPDLVFDP